MVKWFSRRVPRDRGAIHGAAREASRRGGFSPLQFSNPDNPGAHRYRTAQEIIAQIPGGCVDAVVSGVGTGGTLVGLCQGFADFGCSVAPFAARPVKGLALDGAECCSFSGRIPGVADGLSAIYDDFRNESTGLVELDVSDDEALEVARALIRKGFPVGPSSGLNFRAAMMAAERLGPEAQIVTVFPDRIERLLSRPSCSPNSDPWGCTYSRPHETYGFPHHRTSSTTISLWVGSSAHEPRMPTMRSPGEMSPLSRHQSMMNARSSSRPAMSGRGSGVTPQKKAIARAVWASLATARVGAELRCLESTRAVRPEDVATNSSAALIAAISSWRPRRRSR